MMTVNELIKKLQSIIWQEGPLEDCGNKRVVIPLLRYDLVISSEICLTVLKSESEVGKMFKLITSEDL